MLRIREAESTQAVGNLSKKIDKLEVKIRLKTKKKKKFIVQNSFYLL